MADRSDDLMAATTDDLLVFHLVDSSADTTADTTVVWMADRSAASMEH